MSQGNDFAKHAASNGAGATASEDVWFVAVASDDIKQMSIEQLDEAFRLGIISAETAVWTEGMEAWAPLGEVADLGDDDESGNDESSNDDAGSEISSGVVSAPAPFMSADVSRDAMSRDAMSRDAMSSNMHASFAAGPSSVAPVTASFAPSAPFVQSTMPVALNVDEDMPPVRLGRRFKPERWLLAAAAVVGLGVTAYNNSDLFASTPGPVAAAAAPAADSKPASRGYDVGGDVGGGVEKGAALPSEPKDEPATKAADDAPIGASSSVAAKEAAAKESTKEAAEPAATVVDKQSLKGSFSKAFNKKAPTAKPVRAVKSRKAAAKPKAKAAKSKKSSATKAASAFDPLNDSLP